jgi:hypothetical protein
MSKPPSLAVERPRRHGNRALQPSDHDDMATSQLQLSPYCIGCCSIIIPQTDGMMPYCQECIQSNEDIAADYHRLLDLSQAPRWAADVRRTSDVRTVRG